MAWDIGKAIAAFGEAVTTIVADTAGSIYRHQGVGGGLPSMGNMVDVTTSAWEEFGPDGEEDVEMQSLIQYLPEDAGTEDSFPAERMEELNPGMIDTRIMGMEGLLGKKQ